MNSLLKSKEAILSEVDQKWDDFVSKNFKKNYIEKYLMVLINSKISPFIYCKNCNKFFATYKWSETQKKIYNNASSNILKHAKCSKSIQPKLPNFSKTTLPPSLRSEIAKLYALEISKHPTISFNAGVDTFNKIANHISSLAIKASRNYEFDVSRQFVSEQHALIGSDQKTKNSKFFASNSKNSSLVIDHWSKAGTNFLGIIARTTDNHYKVNEYLLCFNQASSDKSGDGVFQDLISKVPSFSSRLPVTSDNCFAMNAALAGYKNGPERSRTKKIYCIEHILAKIDENVHKISPIKKLDAMIADINSFFNYRHTK